MKYVFGCDFYFDVEANNYEEAIQKGWDFIHSNLPECFDTEGQNFGAKKEKKMINNHLLYI